MNKSELHEIFRIFIDGQETAIIFSNRIGGILKLNEEVSLLNYVWVIATNIN